MNDFILETMIDIWAYKVGYGDTYLPEVLESIYELRDELYKRINFKDNYEKTYRQLLVILENDEDIKRKSGKNNV